MYVIHDLCDLFSCGASLKKSFVSASKQCMHKGHVQNHMQGLCCSVLCKIGVFSNAITFSTFDDSLIISDLEDESVEGWKLSGLES